MKYKFDLVAIFIFAAVVWPVFAPNYSPTQIILALIFSYFGIRLCYIVYFQNKNS
jgi:multisubunit Na+/H+ antiporter MnhE subunit